MNPHTMFNQKCFFLKVTCFNFEMDICWLVIKSNHGVLNGFSMSNQKCFFLNVPVLTLKCLLSWLLCDYNHI